MVTSAQIGQAQKILMRFIPGRMSCMCVCISNGVPIVLLLNKKSTSDQLYLIHDNHWVLILTHWDWDKLAAIFLITLFLVWKLLYSIEILIKLIPLSNGQLGSTDSHNGLVPNNKPMGVSTNDGIIYWCVYASLSLKTSPPGQNDCNFANYNLRCIFMNENIVFWLTVYLSLFLMV